MDPENLTDRISALETEVGSLKERLDNLESTSNELSHDKPISIAEYKLDFTPSKHAEKALIIGRYYETHGGQRNFSIEDIKDGYRKCKWKPPANPSDTIGKAAGKQGWFMEDGTTEDGKKLWMVTETGLEHLTEQVHDDDRD